MSKAEERALEAYPYNRAYTDNDIEYDGNFCNRLPYIEGYEQAEEDLKLTVEDVRRIYLLVISVSDLQGWKGTDKSIYQEVLKRFKDYKESNKNE